MICLAVLRKNIHFDGIILSAAFSRNNIEMFLNDSGSPALIKDPGDFNSIFVVMPMKG